MATRFGPNGTSQHNTVFIPVALEATGAHDKGVEKLIKTLKQMRRDNGKSHAPHLVSFWRRSISHAIHTAISHGATNRIQQIAQQRHLPGWRNHARVVDEYQLENLPR